ncbi:unnamed protein product [Rotaria sp. Silwood2]|nr:unnamed protein product [Rotaria sp. Silwood2]
MCPSILVHHLSLRSNPLQFLCSMENGVIHAYHAGQARRAYKKIPTFPRTIEPIDTAELFNTIAVTLDTNKR